MPNSAPRQRDTDHPEQDADSAGTLLELAPMLDLADLVADAEGEVVLYNDSGLRSLIISTEAEKTGEGVSETHQTLAGEDVSGCRFILFDNGLKLFYPPDLELILARKAADAS